MMFFFSLIPATFLVVAGYFILFASSKADGGVRSFGKYLSIWVFILAALFVLGGALAPTFGIGHMRKMDGMHGYMQRMEEMQQRQLELMERMQQQQEQ